MANAVVCGAVVRVASGLESGGTSSVRRAGVQALRSAAALLVVGLASFGCSRDGGFTYNDKLAVAKGTAVAGDGQTVTLRGKEMHLAGRAIQVGDSLRDVTLTELTANGPVPVKLADAAAGKVRIISVVPSLDTPVCEQQTHYLSEKNAGLDKSIQMVTVSIDTPFAQGRFAREAKIQNVKFLSDFRAAEFGTSYGLLVEEPHLLARAVMVVDAQNVIRYLQVIPEVTQMPDMEAAFEAARKLASS